MQNSELCVSAKTLQIDGASPAVGDEVEVTIKGKVTRAEGGNVYLQPETANGQPMQPGDADDKGGAEEGEPSEEQLREMAGRADQTGD